MKQNSKLFIETYNKLEKKLRHETGAKYNKRFYHLIEDSNNESAPKSRRDNFSL